MLLTDSRKTKQKILINKYNFFKTNKKSSKKTIIVDFFIFFFFFIYAISHTIVGIILEENKNYEYLNDINPQYQLIHKQNNIKLDIEKNLD